MRVYDINQPSYMSRKPTTILKTAENDRTHQYLDAWLNQRRHFTPFVVSCKGLYGKEASFFMKQLAKQLADKWNSPYSLTISLLRIQFTISLVRSKNRCLRGARISLSKISYPCNWEDGAGLHFFSTLE